MQGACCSADRKAFLRQEDKRRKPFFFAVGRLRGGFLKVLGPKVEDIPVFESPPLRPSTHSAPVRLGHNRSSQGGKEFVVIAGFPFGLHPT